MASFFRARIGNINLIVISLIAGLTGALSILSLADRQEAVFIKTHWFAFSCRHVGLLMLVSLVLTLALILFNLLYQGIRYHQVNIALLLNIFLKSLIASFIVALAGNAFLLYNC